MHSHPARTLALVISLATTAGAQSFNVDAGTSRGIGQSPYAGPAGQPGVWNSIPAPFPQTQLLGLDGSLTPVVVTVTGSDEEVFFNNPLMIMGRREHLLEDGQRVDGRSLWRFDGLANGTYEVTTCAWHPAQPDARTQILVHGSHDPVQAVGSFTFNCDERTTTYARHVVQVEAGWLEVYAREFLGEGILNGMQLRQIQSEPRFDAHTDLTSGIQNFGDSFGRSISVTGDVAVVTAPGHTNGIGRSYALERIAGEWEMRAWLDPQATELFTLGYGASVSAGSDMIAIGAPSAQVAGNFVGAVYVHWKTFAGWNGGSAAFFGIENGANFGWSVGVAGDQVLIAAYTSNHAAPHGGTVYVYERSGSNWSIVQEFSPSDVEANSLFGYSLAVDGDWALIGSLFQDQGQGAVYAYKRIGGTWVEMQKLAHPGAPVEGRYGISVAADGGRAVVGSTDVNYGPGWVEFLERTGNTWNRDGLHTPLGPQVSDSFGSNVAIEGDRAAVISENFSTGCQTLGSATVFERGAGGWAQVRRIEPHDVVAPVRLQGAVAIAADEIWLGDRSRELEVQGAGAVYRFTTERVLGERYCTANSVNTTLFPGTVFVTGSTVASAGDVELHANGLPANEFGMFLTSLTPGHVMTPPGARGDLCLGGQIGRFAQSIQSTGLEGTMALTIDTSSMPTSPLQPILAGQAWHFQAWHRDSGASNFTDAVRVTFE